MAKDEVGKSEGKGALGESVGESVCNEHPLLLMMDWMLESLVLR